MPHIVELSLSPVDGTRLPSSALGYNAYALFLSMLRDADPGLASELHDTEDVRPFTLWLVPVKRLASSGDAETAPSHCLRMSFLTDSVFSAFMHAALVRGDRPLKVGDALLNVSGISVVDIAHPVLHSRSYEEIVAHAGVSPIITLRFVSPTTFRSGGRRNVVFPEPALVFGSLLARWNRFSGSSLDMERLRNVVRAACAVVRYRLKTAVLSFGAYRETGFVGDVCYEAASLAEEDLRVVNALADFAVYAGVGAKTSMGMGQTRRRDTGCTVRGGAGRNTEEGR